MGREKRNLVVEQDWLCGSELLEEENKSGIKCPRVLGTHPEYSGNEGANRSVQDEGTGA